MFFFFSLLKLRNKSQKVSAGYECFKCDGPFGLLGHIGLMNRWVVVLGEVWGGPIEELLPSVILL